MSLSPDLRQKIEQLVASDSVVLFMKGNRSFPQCGFSASVVNILNTLVPKYTTVNILADAELRAAMKDYSDWPTFPQLYIGGEFVGGADIVGQLHRSGELASKITGGAVAATGAASPQASAAPAASDAPNVTVTPRAAKELAAALAEAGSGDVIHVSIGATWDHQLDIGPAEPGRVQVKSEGITLQLDSESSARASGLVIDFVESSEGAGFRLDNPNRPPVVKQVTARELKELLDAGKVRLYDVRTEQERVIASIAGSTFFDDDALAAAEKLSKDTPLAFYCHHGSRSQAAAEYLLRQGFRTLYNLRGGIEAWSREVDPKVPRY